MDIANKIYAPDFIAISISDAKESLRGPEGIKKEVLTVRSGAHDIHFTIDHLIAEGELVMGAFTIRGTHTGALWGVPPTGKQFTIKTVDLWKFESGRIVQRYLALFDRLGLLQQLGIASPLG